MHLQGWDVRSSSPRRPRSLRGRELTLKEIRFHGRGGQGAASAGQILAAAFLAEGKYAASFPMYGFERRGAPVTAYTRVDNIPIREKTQIYYPDCLIVLDPAQKSSATVFSGLKPGGILVLNSAKLPQEKTHENVKIVGVVDATTIALEEIGLPATNTCMLGAFVKTTGLIKLDSLLPALGQYFKGELLDKNVRSAIRGFRETKIIE